VCDSHMTRSSSSVLLRALQGPAAFSKESPSRLRLSHNSAACQRYNDVLERGTSSDLQRNTELSFPDAGHEKTVQKSAPYFTEFAECT
jgi:hypothetical protein